MRAFGDDDHLLLLMLMSYISTIIDEEHIYKSDDIIKCACSSSMRKMSRCPSLARDFILKNRDSRLSWKDVVKNYVLDDELAQEARGRVPRYYIKYNCIDVYQKLIREQKLGTRTEVSEYFKSIRNKTCIQEYVTHICGREGFATVDFLVKNLEKRGYIDIAPSQAVEEVEASGVSGVRDAVEAQSCSICLEDVNCVSEPLVCGHVFHRNCIYNWECVSYFCPVCRSDISRNTPISKCARSRRISKKKTNNMFETLLSIEINDNIDEQIDEQRDE